MRSPAVAAVHLIPKKAPLGGLLTAFLLAACSLAAAAWESRLDTIPGAGVDVTLTSPFDQFPRSGYAPVIVTIANESGSTRRWSIRLTATLQRTVVQSSSGTSGVIEVPDGATRTLRLLIPLLPMYQSNFTSRSLRAEVTGFGIERPRTNLPGDVGGGGAQAWTFVGMSAELGNPIWQNLRAALSKRSNDFAGTIVDFATLGDDWRELSGFDVIWISAAEYAALLPGPRQALLDWLARGGSLFYCIPEADSPLPAELTGDGPLLGKVERRILIDGQLPLEATADRMKDLEESQQTRLSTGYAQLWSLAASLGVVDFDGPLLAIFIALFAVVVGPLNIYWFAGSGRRHRLFWTTPLISIGASLLLGGLIALQDGLGGSGERVMLTVLQPERKRAVVMQEQVARTGVLASRNFSTSESVLMSPVTVDPGRDEVTSRSFLQAGSQFSGDWFLSRALQGQFLESIVPTRGEIRVLNGSAGSPPVILSSLPMALQNFRFRDAAGLEWVSATVPTGEQVILERATEPKSVAETVVAAGGAAMIARAWQQSSDRPGWFHATVPQPTFFATLPAIRWQQGAGLVAGPVTPEGGQP